MKTGYLKKHFQITLPALLCLLVLVGFVCVSIPANLDLSAGRYALFMDERITFDGVQAILHPDGFKSFLHAVVAGDQRYGRSLWMSIAAFAAVPEWIWGGSGQIIAARMLQVLLIASACGLWLFGILRNWYLRLVLGLTMLGMPYSDYYMSMPKPEPLQLLFLSLFCYFYFKNKLKFGWHWIFIGLAFGTKISTLPAIIVFICAALFIHHKNKSDGDLKYPAKVAALSFSLGLACAVPLLWLPVLLGIAGYYAFIRLKHRFGLSLASQCILALVGLIAIKYLARREISTWLDNTFRNTTHGADQQSINFFSWVNYFFADWLIAPRYLGLIFFVLAFLFIAISAIFLLRNKIASDNDTTAITITIAGIALNLAIFVGAHRLWGFYLYPGSILMLAGLVMLIDLRLVARSAGPSTLPWKGLNAFGGLLAIGLFCFATIFWAPTVVKNLAQLSNRTKSQEYIEQYETYQAILTFLNERHKTENKTLKVTFTPSLFPPDNGAKYQLNEFWGPYVQWQEVPDVIVFSASHTLSSVAPQTDSPEYTAFLREREGYAAHVTEQGIACKLRPCFERELRLPGGGEILVLAKE